MQKEGSFLCLFILVLVTLVTNCNSYPDGVGQPSSDSQNRPKLPVISVWARKAGGNLRPEFLLPVPTTPPESLTTKPESEISRGESEEIFNAILNPMPTVAPTVPYETKNEAKTSTMTTTHAPSTSTTTIRPKLIKDDLYSYESSEEDDDDKCPEDQFWHLRGKQCVPLRCPEGISKRNSKTGECVDLFVGWGSRGRRRMYPYANNRYYAKVLYIKKE